jgi:hypothetical protein
MHTTAFAARMEHLWSRAGAIGGNRARVSGHEKRLRQAESVALYRH